VFPVLDFLTAGQSLRDRTRSPRTGPWTKARGATNLWQRPSSGRNP